VLYGGSRFRISDLLDVVWGSTGTGVTLILKEWVAEIEKRNQEQISQNTARQADVELLNSIDGNHLNFIKLEVELGKLERWTTEWDCEKTSILLIDFYGAIEREENNLYVHTKRTFGNILPVIESKKEAYLYCLRQLRTTTHSLAISQNKHETSAQFQKTVGELFLTKLSLMKTLQDAIAIDNSTIHKN
jgi:hypothetical protein